MIKHDTFTDQVSSRLTLNASNHNDLKLVLSYTYECFFLHFHPILGVFDSNSKTANKKNLQNKL